jgi:hypothetical protein
MAAKKKPATPTVEALPYTGNTDAEGKTAAHPAARKLMAILVNNQFQNLGIYANRPMRGSTRLSVHATGRALDAGYKQSRQDWVTGFCDWLAEHHRELLIEEIHQYVWGTHGRGFRCNRNGKPGWLTWDAENNGGPGGYWIHIEVAPNQTADGIVQAWKRIPPFTG